MMARAEALWASTRTASDTSFASWAQTNLLVLLLVQVPPRSRCSALLRARLLPLRVDFRVWGLCVRGLMVMRGARSRCRSCWTAQQTPSTSTSSVVPRLLQAPQSQRKVWSEWSEAGALDADSHDMAALMLGVHAGLKS